MGNIEIRTDSMNLPNRAQFLYSCGPVMEHITASAPSDSIINLAVDFDGSDYLVNLDLISGELNFSSAASAKSAFVALEKIHKESMERIRKWATTRKIEVA